MDIRPARFGMRRAGLVHKNSPAWKTKKRTAEMIWLQYFNEKLFEQKKIDETARNKLRLAIMADGRKT